MKNLYKIVFIVLILISTNITTAQENFRVMTYNILNYPSKIPTTRNPYFKKVIAEADPDILVVQEIESIYGVTLFHEQVLDTSYTAGGFIDGFDTDNAIFFKHTKFNFISNIPIYTSLRNISELTMEYKPTGDTLIIYSVHLKASSGTTNEQKRLAEVKELRKVTDKLPVDANYMVVGDFNFYNSGEPAFQELINQTNSGYFLDPINKIGYWHNNSSYRGIHTQSTRTTNLADEGSTGGLDDRFDFILVSQAVIDSGSVFYIPKSYTTLGNDGNHLNKALIDLPNAVVSDEVATALYYSSDHLPVYADFEIQNVTSVISNKVLNNNFELKQNYPNPFNPSTRIEYTIPAFEMSGATSLQVQLKIYDILGNEVATLVDENQKPGNYKVNFDGSDLSSGFYAYVLKAGVNILSKKMLLIK